MKVTLVLTVLNESHSLPTLLDSIAAQTRQPDEIVVCDGGSCDGTLSLLRGEPRFTVHVVEAPGANISRGRNLAIAAASHELIACTDAGVRLDPRWLEKLTEPFASGDFRFSSESSIPAIPVPILGTYLIPRPDPSPRIGIEGISGIRDVNRQSARQSAAAGFFVPDPHTTFEVAMSATVLPELRDIQPEKFLPSSRSVAFLKSAWQAVGGYPEWLDYCEDLIFDLKLRQQFGAFAFAPDAIAYFRPRGSLRAFFKQYYLYARGDGKAGLFFKRHLVRYATYVIALPALVAGILFGAPLVKLIAALVLLSGAIVYTRTPYRRLRTMARDLPFGEKVKAIALVPIIRVVGDTAKMIGYPAGVWWRVRHK